MNKLFTLAATVLGVTVLALTPAHSQAPPEAPAGFDDVPNGLVSQAVFDADRAIFDEQEEIDEGLGPVYNARSCGECHANPVSGGISQITELRAGRFDGVSFFEHPGGTLITSRAINAKIQERVIPNNNVRSFRTSLNTLGDGFVEAINSNTLAAIQAAQPPGLRGQIITVPVLEAAGALRVGRFGWKNQHASLISFAADAYLNEMGITSPFAADEQSSNGASVAAFDTVPDPEEAPTPEFPEGEDIAIFARFMRATKVPPRDAALAATPAAVAGAQIFGSIGCGVCHTAVVTTAAVGTVINGGAFVVPPALGGKVIRPYSDFLLHDVGTGDGIVQNGGASTRNKLRTAPLWGVRTRNRLMHDGESLTFNEAILRHAGEATPVTLSYSLLSATQRSNLITFLTSL